MSVVTTDNRFGDEKIVYYGCVFQENDGKNYCCFLPKWESHKIAGKLMLHHIDRDNAPIIGCRVDIPCRFALFFTYQEVDQMIPIGKFGMDEYYDLEGRCTLVEFSDGEKLLTNLQLVDSIREQFLDYKKRVPYGSQRSLEDLERLGLATDEDYALDREQKKSPGISLRDGIIVRHYRNH